MIAPTHTRLGLLCSLCVFCGMLDLSSARAASFQGMGILPNETWSKAAGVSGDGSVAVGTSCNANAPPCEAFRWTSAGGISGLGFVPGSSNSYATGISRDGATVVGYASGDTQAVYDYPYCIGAECTGFVWTAAQGFVKAGQENTAVSADGSLVVGFSAYAPTINSNMEAYRWTSSAGTVYLGFPSYPPNAEDSYAWAVSGSSFGSGTVVVGEGGGATVNNISSLFAFRWDPADGMVYLGTLPGDAYSAASGVSFDGSVIVGTSYPNSPNNSTSGQAFRWTAATGMVGLSFLSGYSGSVATAISSNGAVVVGYAVNSQGSPQAVLWTSSDGVQSVQALLTAAGVNTTRWVLQEATAVSADGHTIVGYGIDPAGNTEAWIASVPLPASSHDFNDDGKSDILWRDTSGDLALWLMSGGTVAQSGGVGTVPTTWSVVGQRDFSGDGDADMLWRDSAGDTSIWLMSGLSVSSTAGLGNVPTNWTIAGTGDLNGDGKGDLLWRDTAGDIAIWFMNGGTVASSASLGNLATSWTIVGDDSKGDIFLHDNAGNYVIWQVSGAQVVANAGLGNVPLATWSIVGLGDFNGDGNTDILWRDTSGDTAIWFLDSSLAVQSTAGLGNIPANWTVAQTGDYNGDGYSDILWIDSAGDTALWLMNGSTVLSSAGLGNVGTTWSVQSANAE